MFATSDIMAIGISYVVSMLSWVILLDWQLQTHSRRIAFIKVSVFSFLIGIASALAILYIFAFQGHNMDYISLLIIFVSNMVWQFIHSFNLRKIKAQ